jgi:hypothetical protein
VPCAKPTVEQAAALFSGQGFVVRKVVGLTHKSVDGADGVAASGWKSDKGVVKILGFTLGDGAAGGVGRF